MNDKSKTNSWNREQYNYYLKIKPYIHLIGIGLFFLMISFPIIVMSLFFAQSQFLIEITYVWCIIFFIYWMAIPLLLQFIRRYGIGIWMSWDINLNDFILAYYGVFGMLGLVIIFIAYNIYFAGYNIFTLDIGPLVIMLIIMTIIGVFLMTKYMQKANNRKRFIMIHDKEKSVKDAFNKILESSDLKSTKKWMGSKLTGYPVLQIENLSINYKISQRYGLTTIEIESQMIDNEPNIKKIETAISNYFGFRSDYF